MIQQLLLAKRLFMEARSYMDRSDPISCGIGISMLQDSVELYLWAVIKEKNLVTPKEQSGFAAYVEILRKADVPVPHASKLQDLNKARVGFKHYGNLPDRDEAKKHQTYVEDFLREAMQAHFGTAFEDLTLLDLIADDETRRYLKEAARLTEQGKYDEAAGELAKARYQLFAKFNQFIPAVDTKLRNADSVLFETRENVFSYLSDYLNGLREATLAGLLRLPLSDFHFLRTRLPSVSRTFGGRWYIVSTRGPATEVDCRRGLDCLINLAVRFESFSS